MFKDKEFNIDKEIKQDINIIKPFSKGQDIKIENIKRKIIDIDKDNNVLVDVQIIDNQGNSKTVKQWYTIQSVELI